MDGLERTRDGRTAKEVTSRGRFKGAEEEYCGGYQEAALR